MGILCHPPPSCLGTGLSPTPTRGPQTEDQAPLGVLRGSEVPAPKGLKGSDGARAPLPRGQGFVVIQPVCQRMFTEPGRCCKQE